LSANSPLASFSSADPLTHCEWRARPIHLRQFGAFLPTRHGITQTLRCFSGIMLYFGARLLEESRSPPPQAPSPPKTVRFPLLAYDHCIASLLARISPSAWLPVSQEALPFKAKTRVKCLSIPNSPLFSRYLDKSGKRIKFYALV
jgi:hypothetical protein